MHKAAAGQRSALLLDGLNRFTGPVVLQPLPMELLAKKTKSKHKTHLDICLPLLVVVFCSSRQYMVSL